MLNSIVSGSIGSRRPAGNPGIAAGLRLFALLVVLVAGTPTSAHAVVASTSTTESWTETENWGWNRRSAFSESKSHSESRSESSSESHSASHSESHSIVIAYSGGRPGHFPRFDRDDDNRHHDGDPCTVSQVPLPAALPLFLSALALLGLGGWRRKTRAAA